MILGHLKALHDQRHTHKVSVREWDKLNEEARSELKQTNNRYRERWLTVLTELKAQGILRSDVESARRMLVASLNWTLHYRDTDLMDLGALADQMGGVGLNMDVDGFRALHQSA